MRTRRIGVLGGTFDPVHQGHLILAQEALARLRLDRVVFMPASRSPLKRGRDLSRAEHRVAMLRLATRGHPRFEVSTVEAARRGVSFTVSTLEALRRRGRGSIFFLMGQDSLEEFSKWREPGRILELARLVVMPRGEAGVPSLDPSLKRRVIYLNPPRIGISSTEIRRRVRLGLPIRYWTPDAVVSYIARHGLYRHGTRRG